MRSVAAIASLLIRQACGIAFVAAAALPQEAIERPDPLARWLPLLEAARAEMPASERAWLDDELFEIDVARGALDSARARLPARLAKSHSAQVLQLLQAHLQRGELPQARRLLSHTHGMDQSAALWDIGLAEARRGDSNLEQTLQRQPEAQRKLLRALARAHGNEPAPLGEVRQALLALPASDERDLCISVLIDLAATANDEPQLLATVAALSRGQPGTLRSLSLAAAARGDHAMAERLAAKITDQHARTLCWLELSLQAAQSGNQAIADRSWQAAEGTGHGVEHLGAFWSRAAAARARLLAQNNANEAASKLLGNMTERLLALRSLQARQDALIALVVAQQQLGDTDAAAASWDALVRSHGEPSTAAQTDLRMRLAASLAAAGLLDLALREQPDLRDSAVLYVFGSAFGQAKAHDKAESFWQRIPESPARISFLRSYVLALIRS
jgi:hypothetical protein